MSNLVPIFEEVAITNLLAATDENVNVSKNDHYIIFPLHFHTYQCVRKYRDCSSPLCLTTSAAQNGSREDNKIKIKEISDSEWGSAI